MHYCQSSPSGDSFFYGWFSAMHTRVDIAMYGYRPEDEWIRIMEHIRQEVLRLDSIGNCYDERSELAIANRIAAFRSVSISDDLYEMLSICKEFHEHTMGYFDVTVHSQDHNADMITNVCLDKNVRTLSYKHPSVFINLSGFIKGYALEKIRTILNGYDVVDALVNMGNSSILALGNHPNGEGWKMTDDCVLCNQCLTVSGNDDGQRKHIITPLTGEWVLGCGKVFVVTECAYIGEILSTALFAATEAKRPMLLGRLGKLGVDCKCCVRL